MAADLEIFKRLYLCSLTSYGIITGFADFSFTERCYWYLQSALNPCLTPAPLSVQKPDFPISSSFSSFFLSFYFHLSSSSQAISVLPEPLELVSSQFFSTWVKGCATTRSKEERRHFLLMNFMTAVALWFDAI